jgi:hypothetical protein
MRSAPMTKAVPDDDVSIDELCEAVKRPRGERGYRSRRHEGRETDDRLLGHAEAMSRLLVVGVIGTLAVANASCGGSASSVGTDSGSPGGSSSGSTSGSASGGTRGSGSGAGSPGGGSSSGGGPSEADPPFFPPPPPSPFAGIGPGCTIMNGTGAGTLGQTECTTTLGETCGDAGYQATCACPQGTCACFGGAATNVVSFSGCPSCPMAEEAFTLCGFPHQ